MRTSLSQALLWGAGFTAFFGFASKSQAQEVHTFYTSSRALGMGGAQIAVVNDETALLANPAGLGKLRDTYGTILDPEVDIGSNDIALYQNQNFSNPLDPSQVVPSLANSPGTYYHARAQLFPSFVVKNFGIGIFAKEELDMQMNSAKTSVNTFYREDAGLALGYNFRFFDGRVKLGITGRAMDRVEINNTAVPYPATNFAVSNLASEGAGFGTDVGLILTAPWKYLPTLSAVARDVGGTQFTAGKNILMTSTNIPASVSQDYDVAVALFPIDSKTVRSSFTVEAQQILAAQQSLDQMRYLHGGFEFNFSDIMFLRGGMNGHWWTAGFELASEHLQFQATSYGQDIGQGANIVEDRRYVLKIALRF